MVLCVAMNVSDSCCHLTTVWYSSHISHPPLLIMVTTFAPSHHVFTRCPEERTHSRLYSHSQPWQPLTADYCPVPVLLTSSRPGLSMQFPKQLEDITYYCAGKLSIHTGHSYLPCLHVTGYIGLITQINTLNYAPTFPHMGHWNSVLVWTYYHNAITALNMIVFLSAQIWVSPSGDLSGRREAAAQSVATLSGESAECGPGPGGGVTVNTQVSPLPPPIRGRVGGFWPMRGRVGTGTRQCRVSAEWGETQHGAESPGAKWPVQCHHQWPEFRLQGEYCNEKLRLKSYS